MKILFPIGSFHPAKAGGPSKTMHWHVSALGKKKIESIVLATSTGIESSHQLELDTWLEKPYGKIMFCSRYFHYLPFKLLWKSIRLIPKVDIIHLTAISYPPSIIIAIFSVLYRKPIVWSIRGGLEESAIQHRKSGLKKMLNKLIGSFSRKSVWFHVTSENEKSQVQKHLQPKKEIIKVANFFPNELALQKKKKNFLFFLGRINEIKGLEFLIEALSKSQLFKEKGFKLKLAGNHQNEYGAFLQKKSEQLGIANQVEFLGRVDGREKRILLSEAYGLILPSHSENFGNVIVEALVEGTPVIASKGTPWEDLEKTNAGYWVKNDPDTLSKTIDKLLALESQAHEKMCNNALAFSKQFDITLNIQKWEDIYKSILK